MNHMARIAPLEITQDSFAQIKRWKFCEEVAKKVSLFRVCHACSSCQKMFRRRYGDALQIRTAVRKVKRPEMRIATWPSLESWVALPWHLYLAFNEKSCVVGSTFNSLVTWAEPKKRFETFCPRAVLFIAISCQEMAFCPVDISHKNNNSERFLHSLNTCSSKKAALLTDLEHQALA